MITKDNAEKDRVLESISNHGIVPTLTIADVSDAVPLANALVAGGVHLAEVDFRTECAAAATSKIRGELPTMILGAGSVTSVDQVKAAVTAGAHFVLCPDLGDEVVKYCLENGIFVIPGCATASEVRKALSLGLTTLQFFPAEALGGTEAIGYLSSAFGDVRFIAAGGINDENVNKYANSPGVLACSGTWMTDAKLLQLKQFAEITKNVRRTVFRMLNFDFAHVGVMCETADEGYKNIFKLADIFDLTLGDTGSSTYVGRNVEITKKMFRTTGPHGHLGYYTDNVARSMFYLSKAGIEFDPNSYKHYGDKVFVAYLVDRIAGFAVHIEERSLHNPPSWDHRDVIRKKVKWVG